MAGYKMMGEIRNSRQGCVVFRVIRGGFHQQGRQGFMVSSRGAVRAAGGVRMLSVIVYSG